MDNERATKLVNAEAERRGVSVAVKDGRVVWGSGKHEARDEARSLSETARRINRENAIRERKNATEPAPEPEPKAKRAKKPKAEPTEPMSENPVRTDAPDSEAE